MAREAVIVEAHIDVMTCHFAVAVTTTAPRTPSSKCKEILLEETFVNCAHNPPLNTFDLVVMEIVPDPPPAARSTRWAGASSSR